MQKVGTNWLPDRMRKFIGKNGGADLSTANDLLLDLAKNSEQILALRVNELLEGKNKCFAEAHESLVEQAIKVASEKVQSAELAKCAAEAELERVKGRIEIKIRKIEEQMQRAALQLAAAEERANKAETSYRRLQAAILAKSMMTSLAPRAA